MRPRLVKPKHGHGKLWRGGRKVGSKPAVTKAFEEFSKMTLSDPDVQARIRGRLAQELNRKTGPVPILLALVAASAREKPNPHGANVTFIAQIINGRGQVHQVALDELGRETEGVPALPAARTESDG